MSGYAHCSAGFAQHRGGRGVAGARLREGDGVEEVVPVMDHDTVLFFQPDGLCRSIKAHQIPEGSRTSAGTAIAQAWHTSWVLG